MRCEIPRTVRLSVDFAAWQRTILSAWRDRADQRFPMDLFWVLPRPVNAPWQSFIGHVIVVQEPQMHQAALLLSAEARAYGRAERQQVAILTENYMSMHGAIQLFPIPNHLRSFPLRVRRDEQPFPPQGALRIWNGNHVVIEVLVIENPPRPPSALDEADGHSLLQAPPRRQGVQQEPPDASYERDPDVSHHAHDPVHLRLSDHLTPPTWTLVDCHKLDFLHRQLLEGHLFAPSFDLSGINLSDSTSHALDSTGVWTSEPPLGIDFYTDGSCRLAQAQASTGIVMLVHTANGLKLGGFHTSRCWQATSAPRAEATAIAVALFWAIQLARAHEFCNVPFHFHFDSLFAGHAAQGRCHSDLNKDLTDVVRSLALWLEQIAHHPLQWTHVKGHSNDPWNDLADALAHHAIQSDRYTFDACSCLAAATFDALDFVTVQWLWLYELSLRGHPDAPVLCNRWWKFNAAAPITAQPTAELHPFELHNQPAHVAPEQDAVISLRLATANVLTLYPAVSQSAIFWSARAEDLARQFHRSGVNCIGIQESRCRRHGHDLFEGFHILSAEATDRGHGGVQLWFSRIVRTPKEEIHFAHDHFRIIHGDDRRLIVSLQHPQLCLLLIVLHAPCDDDESVLRTWWKQTSSFIPSSFASWSWLVLTDANSRVGTVRSQAVGPEGAELENLRGSLFHEWLQQHNLWLPQTFDATHTGPHVTWKHPSQGHGRIDYIAVSFDVTNSNVKSWVHETIDLSLTRSRGSFMRVC